MLPAFFALTWLTGLALATAFAAAAYGFGRNTEPERTDLISIAALLMGPAGVSLSIFAYEGFTRYVAGSPISAVAWAVYVWGVLVYVVAYVALVRSR